MTKLLCRKRSVADMVKTKRRIISDVCAEVAKTRDKRRRAPTAVHTLRRREQKTVRSGDKTQENIRGDEARGERRKQTNHTPGNEARASFYNQKTGAKQACMTTQPVGSHTAQAKHSDSDCPNESSEDIARHGDAARYASGNADAVTMGSPPRNKHSMALRINGRFRRSREHRQQQETQSHTQHQHSSRCDTKSAGTLSACLDFMLMVFVCDCDS